MRRWLRAEAFAALELGLSPSTFWSLGPAESKALMEVWEEREERSERRAAKICAVIANCHRDRKKRARPYTEDDFMPRKKLTPEQIEKKVKAIFGWHEQQ